MATNFVRQMNTFNFIVKDDGHLWVCEMPTDNDKWENVKSRFDKDCTCTFHPYYDGPQIRFIIDGECAIHNNPGHLVTPLVSQNQIRRLLVWISIISVSTMVFFVAGLGIFFFINYPQARLSFGSLIVILICLWIIFIGMIKEWLK